ncbi:MAG: hypothetical protein HQM13_07465 [SAR324 cluster bacterium]|nr:hypothetical protein [SAR324 cluster bacterium]
MKVKHILFLIASMVFLLGGEKFASAETENSGLGPLEVRDQFPVALPFLSMSPENTSTIGDNIFFFSYQMAVANTFLNSAGRNKQITKDQVKRGLVEADFFSNRTGKPIPGYHTYIDVESYRHLFRMKYGLFDSMEFGFEFSYISFVGGSLDVGSELVHDLVGIGNDTSAGAYRANAERDRYDYYLLNEDSFLINTSDPFENVASDPLFKFKWNAISGNSIFPAVSFKLVYKLATPNRTKDQQLVSSGHSDFGTYLLLSKAYGNWVVYLGWGNSKFEQSGEFSNGISNRFITLEYQVDPDLSIILQTVSQSSIFKTSGRLSGTSQESNSAFLSNLTDVAVIGYKQWFGNLLLETGFVEDYNQSGNQTDIVLFFELGQRW